MAARGPGWRTWVDALPRLMGDHLSSWALTVDGPLGHGHCSVVAPVRTADSVPAVLKIGYPDAESEHEHLALRRWAGNGAVRLLRADPHRRALLLERLAATDLTEHWDIEACEVVGGLYRRLHVPAMPQLRSLGSCVEQWTAELTALPRSAPIPRRLVEQAATLGRELAPGPPSRVLHGDLHYSNVLAGNVLAAEREPWLAIDPKPINGDPHYELAPMLWNRWDELAGDIRGGVRRRFYTLVEAAEFDEDRARAWVVVRMVHNAMWELTRHTTPDPHWLTVCIAVAKAVQD